MQNEKLTLIYTYFGQSERIPDIIKEKHPDCRVIIIDDHSSVPLKIDPPAEGIEIYRITDDLGYNVVGARNLGFSLVDPDSSVICADIDHLVTHINIEQILKLKKEQGTVYYLGRDSAYDIWNLYLIHIADFNKVGGYNNDFISHYGYDDLLFRDMCNELLKVVEVRDIKVKDYSEISHTKGLDRNFDRNKQIYETLKNYLKETPVKINLNNSIFFNWQRVQ